MCGISGYLQPSSREIETNVIRSMTDKLHHRGPDDSGFWCDDAIGLALGHRRLAIIDLSTNGHQPMESASGRFVLVFNGELYNYREVAGQLRKMGHSFRGQSDTEVLLAAIEEWGVTKAIQSFTGMFAIALWDRSENLLYLTRDRIGKKPLYYGWSGGAFMFASELKALKPHPGFFGEIDSGAVHLALRHGFIPAPWSIYKGFFKLTPGTILALRPENCRSIPANFSPFPEDQLRLISPAPYWDLRQVAQEGKQEPFSGSLEEASFCLEEILYDAVKTRMISDVPLGAFLSGGLDSSTIVALMSKISKEPVRTFSIGFREESHNEAEHAKTIASHLGCKHTEVILSANDALEVVPLLPAMFDEPFADSSQIPTYLVSKISREHVTVALSGDGGDELFCGYERYGWAEKNRKIVSNLPFGLRKLTSGLIGSVSAETYDNSLKFINAGLPGRFQDLNAGRKLHTLSRILKYKDEASLYRGLMSNFDRATEYIRDPEERATVFDQYKSLCARGNHCAAMMLVDTLCYLPDDIMVKVDRSSMAVSLEARAPFLDHRVVEFAWSLPDEYKMSSGVTKRVLRELLSRHLPPSLTERPKQGFAIPIADWLRKELRPWAEQLLDENTLHEQGFLHPAAVSQVWQQHLSGKRNWDNLLWSILSFQAWLSANLDHQPELPSTQELQPQYREDSLFAAA